MKLETGNLSSTGGSAFGGKLDAGRVLWGVRTLETAISGWSGRNVLLVLSVLVAPLCLRAASLDNSIDLKDHDPIPLESSMQNVVTKGAGWYDFADRDGDGTSNAVTPPGLNLAGFDLYSTGSTNIWLSLNNGDITGTSGSIHITGNYPRGIRIHRVGAMTMGNGSVYLHCGTSTPGDICIGQDGVAGPRAGPIQVNGIWTKSGAWTSGGVTIHGSGDVLIQNASGTATNLDISAPKGSTPDGILIRHDGTFVVDQVLSVTGEGGKDILFDGDAETNGASGTFTAALIDTHSNRSRGDVTIRNYLSVTFGSVDMHVAGSYLAGDLLVTGIVNEIIFTGSLDLGSQDDDKRGQVGLHAGGVIRVNSLNLSNVLYAVFDSGGKSYILGPITGTDGQPATGPGNIGTALRAPAGEVIYYRPEETPTLNGQSFILADPAGTPGAGGLFRCEPKGTIVWFK